MRANAQNTLALYTDHHTEQSRDAKADAHLARARRQISSSKLVRLVRGCVVPIKLAERHANTIKLCRSIVCGDNELMDWLAFKLKDELARPSTLPAAPPAPRPAPPANRKAGAHYANILAMEPAALVLSACLTVRGSRTLTRGCAYSAPSSRRSQTALLSISSLATRRATEHSGSTRL